LKLDTKLMADGDSTNISEVLGTISDAVVKPVGEELGKMIEVGAQSVSGSDDPQAAAKKQQEEIEKKQKDTKEAAYLRDWFGKLAEEEQKARQAIAQRDQMRAAAQQQDQQKEQSKKMEEAKKDQEMNVAVQIAQTAAERKGFGG
jgi:hypothetical protein